MAQGIFIPNAAGGGGGGKEFAPKYVVGNSAAGDTLANCDFLDTGNGQGIAAACTAAAGARGDIWIRPGTYNLTLGGAPTVAFAVPPGVTVHGAGEGLVIIVGRTSGDMRVFNCGVAATLESMSITSGATTDTVTNGTGLIQFTGFGRFRSLNLSTDQGGTDPGLGSFFWCDDPIDELVINAQFSNVRAINVGSAFYVGWSYNFAFVRSNVSAQDWLMSDIYTLGVDLFEDYGLSGSPNVVRRRALTNFHIGYYMNAFAYSNAQGVTSSNGSVLGMDPGVEIVTAQNICLIENPSSGTNGVLLTNITAALENNESPTPAIFRVTTLSAAAVGLVASNMVKLSTGNFLQLSASCGGPAISGGSAFCSGFDGSLNAYGGSSPTNIEWELSGAVGV